MTAALTSQVASGVRWVAVDQALQQLMRLAIVALLTRLAGPSDFGLIAEAFVFTQLATLLSDLGMGPALVHRRDLEDRHVTTSFTTSALFGAVMTGVLFALAGPIASFFSQPRLVTVLQVMSVAFLVNGLRETPLYLLRRALIFRPFVISSAIAVGVSGVAAVAIAAAGHGVWALVVYAIGETLISMIAAHVLAIRAGVWRLRIGIDRAALRELLAFGASVSGTRAVLYAQLNTDNLLVGKALGATALGFYGLAYRLMLFPLQRIADVVSQVVYPALSSMQGDLARMRAGYFRAVQVTCLVCFPLSMGTVAAAPILVPLAFGDKWRPAVLTVQILAANGPRLAISRLNGAVFQAVGRPSVDLGTTAAEYGLLLVGFVAGLPFDIEGVAVGYTVAGYIALPLKLRFVCRHLGCELPDVFRPLGGITAATLAMLVAAVAAFVLTAGVGSDGVRLAVVVGSGATVYAVASVLAVGPLVRRAAGDLLGRT